MDASELLVESCGRITWEAPLRYDRWKSNLGGEGERAAIAAKPCGLATPLSCDLLDAVTEEVADLFERTVDES